MTLQKMKIFFLYLHKKGTYLPFRNELVGSKLYDLLFPNVSYDKQFYHFYFNYLENIPKNNVYSLSNSVYSPYIQQ